MVRNFYSGKVIKKISLVMVSVGRKKKGKKFLKMKYGNKIFVAFLLSHKYS